MEASFERYPSSMEEWDADARKISRKTCPRALRILDRCDIVVALHQVRTTASSIRRCLSYGLHSAECAHEMKLVEHLKKFRAAQQYSRQ